LPVNRAKSVVERYATFNTKNEAYVAETPNEPRPKSINASIMPSVAE
jgi:hypothetical protein